MSKKLDLFVFSSNNKTNIWAGIGAQMWAVSANVNSRTIKARKTNSKKMKIGSLGLLYCKETKEFTTPFVVYSEVDGNSEVRDIWPEPWILPFKIKTLGTPNLAMSINDVKKQLPVYYKSGKKNITHVLFLHGKMAFTPSKISDDDWKIIIQNLAD